MKKLAFFCMLITVLIGPATGLAQDKPSFVGNWKLDVAQSDFGSEPAPKSMAGSILKDTPQMLSYRVRGVDDKGKPFAYSWSGPEDGSTHPILANGKPVGQQTVKKEPDGTLVRHGEDSTDGSSFDSRGSLSDGNTFIDESTEKSKDGKVTKQKYVFHRVGASAKPAS
jgi:hypothetical protein